MKVDLAVSIADAFRSGIGAVAGEEARMVRYFGDPEAFGRDAFYADPKRTSSLELWDKQAEMVRAVATHTKTATKGAHKIGKSRGLGLLAWWWAYTRPRGRVICTSSIDAQVREIIWREVTQLWRLRKPTFDSLLPQPAQLPAIGVRWNDGRQIIGMTTRDAEGAAGYSSDQLLYLVDEASGIRNELFDAFDGNLASGGSMALFSNPTQPSGYFYDAFHKNRAEYKCLTIRALDSPNVKAGRIVIPGLATGPWCLKREEVWGKDSARYQVRVLGNFPDQGDDAVVPRALVQAANERWDVTDGIGPLIGAIDPARFGGDEKVIGFRRGLKVEPLIVPTDRLDTQDLADRFLQEADRRRNGERVQVRVDGAGVGGGVVDALRAKADGWLEVIDMVGSASPTDEAKYFNLRAECWFGIADFLKAGGALPADDELDLELGAPKYKFKPNEKMIVEPKEEIRKRLGRSPDRADMLSMLVWQADAAPEDWDAYGSDPKDDRGWAASEDDYRLNGGRGY